MARPDSGTPAPDSGVCVARAPNEIGVAACTNGIDDDCDGQADCADSDCNALPPVGECCNGRDDNRNGFVDEFACRCFNQAFCASIGNSGGDVCYDATYSACGPRCNFIGGNSFCSMFAMGTTCNAMTGQCQ